MLYSKCLIIGPSPLTWNDMVQMSFPEGGLEKTLYSFHTSVALRIFKRGSSTPTREISSRFRYRYLWTVQSTTAKSLPRKPGQRVVVLIL